MYIEGIYLNTEVDSTFDNMMSSVADYTGSVKAESTRDFLLALSGAVERSKVVMALGPLFGKSGLINIMSKGLSLPMAEVDWQAIGIEPILDAALPKGAVPLISSNDSLVGMILESGEQSIIVLNEDADMRAEMLETYIEPYIGLKSVEAEKASTADGVTLGDIPADDNNADYNNDYDYDYNAVYDGAYPDGGYDEIIDKGYYVSGGKTLVDDVFDSKSDGNRIGFIEEKDFVLEDEPKKEKKPSKIKKLIVPIIAVLLVGAIIGGYFGYTEFYMPSKCRNDYALLRTYKDEDGDKSLLHKNEIVQFGKLYEMNNDMIGWLTIDGTGIDYPVVSAVNRSESHYKRRTFSGIYGDYGTPYIKHEYSLNSAYPLNLAIFGNNTEDGNMFSDIEKYLDLEYYKAHPIITMNSILYDDTWKIVSVMPMDKNLQTAAVDYTKSYADEPSIPKDYIDALSTYSFINCADTADTEDHLLTLIAPYSKDKDINIVVTARRVRDNESATTDASSATYNETARKTNAITAAVGKGAGFENYLDFFTAG